MPFQVTDDGKTIMVPKKLSHIAQMSVFSNLDLGEVGAIGFEIFEKQNFSTLHTRKR